tara:strand:+ start:1290 stop:1412 length:123 start_codon:yes stop_codon:yes gene_type:complete
MKTIMKSITFSTGVGIPGLAQEHVVAVARKISKNATAHLL